MQFYKFKEKRILDPYERVLISKVIGQIYRELSHGIMFCCPSTIRIGLGTDVQYIEEKHMIKISLRLIFGFNWQNDVHISTCHINPFRHTYARRFSGRRLRTDIRKYYMSIPIGKVRIGRFKGGNA